MGIIVIITPVSISLKVPLGLRTEPLTGCGFSVLLLLGLQLVIVLIIDLSAEYLDYLKKKRSKSQHFRIK